MIRKIAILSLIFGTLGYALNVPSSFKEAYELGKQDELEKIKANLTDLKQMILGMLKFREYLLAGKIPLPIVVKDKVLKSTPEGMKIVQKIRIYFPSDIQLSELEKIAIELTSSDIPQSGYVVYINISDLADYEVAYLKLQLKKIGYSPFRFKNWLVVKVYDNEATAIKNAEYINQTLEEKGIFSPQDNLRFKVIKIDLYNN